MQLLPPLTSDPKIIAREKAAGDHLPYARHVDDVTLETRDGLLMQTIRLGGLLFETADTDELNYRSDLRDAMLRAIGNSQFAIYHHVVRRKAEAALEAHHPDAFSRDLDARWRQRLPKNVSDLEAKLKELEKDPRNAKWSDIDVTNAFRAVGNSLGNNPEFKDLWPKPWADFDGLQNTRHPALRNLKNDTTTPTEAERKAILELINEARPHIANLKKRL